MEHSTLDQSEYIDTLVSEFILTSQNLDHYHIFYLRRYVVEDMTIYSNIILRDNDPLINDTIMDAIHVLSSLLRKLDQYDNKDVPMIQNILVELVKCVKIFATVDYIPAPKCLVHFICLTLWIIRWEKHSEKYIQVIGTKLNKKVKDIVYEVCPILDNFDDLPESIDEDWDLFDQIYQMIRQNNPTKKEHVRELIKLTHELFLEY